AAKHRPGPRVTELATLPVDTELDARHDAVAAARRQGDDVSGDLEHVTVHLGEQAEHLFHEDIHRGRRVLGRRRPRDQHEESNTEGETQGAEHYEWGCAHGPRLADRIGGVKETKDKRGMGCPPCPVYVCPDVD